MSEFNRPIESKSSERSKSDAEKTSSDRLSQQSSIRDLLAYDNDRHDQRAKALSLTQDLTQQEGKLPPGTFAPQNPILEQVLTPTVNTVQQAAEDLELLAQIVCDRISPYLNSQMERRGFHQSNRIFSHQTIATDQISSESKQAADVLERLTEEIEQLLHHRLVHERERRGRFVGCLPW